MAPPHSDRASLHLFSRDAAGTTSGPNQTTIEYAGFGLVGLVVIALGVSILIVLRRRQALARQSTIARAPDYEGSSHKEATTSMSPFSFGKFPYSQKRLFEKPFSRENLTTSIILPERAFLRPGTKAGQAGSDTSDPTPSEVHSFYAARGTLPRPFSLIVPSDCPPYDAQSLVPSMLANSGAEKQSHSSSGRPDRERLNSTISLAASSARIANTSPEPLEHSLAPSTRSSISCKRLSDLSSCTDGKAVRDSFLSFFAYAFPRPPDNADIEKRPTSWVSYRLSVDAPHPPSPAPASISIISTSGGRASRGVHTQRVQQLFIPILPDEPHLALGERLSILRTCEDGWCIVARSVLTGVQHELELGAVPAWVFVKPLKGLHGERPVRGVSLGVMVDIDPASIGLNIGNTCDRSAVVKSWCNF